MTLIFRRKEQRHVFQISKIVWKITNNWPIVQINNIFTRQKCKHVWITLLAFTAFPEWLLHFEQRGSVSSSCYCYFYFVTCFLVTVTLLQYLLVTVTVQQVLLLLCHNEMLYCWNTLLLCQWYALSVLELFAPIYWATVPVIYCYTLYNIYYTCTSIYSRVSATIGFIVQQSGPFALDHWRQGNC